MIVVVLFESVEQQVLHFGHVGLSARLTGCIVVEATIGLIIIF